MRFPKALLILLQDYRFLFLALALILYGCLSSPTPDNPSYIEVLIGLSLLVFIGADGVLKPFQKLFVFKVVQPWELAGLALLLWGVAVPTIMALYNNALPSILLRDVVSFAFLMAPLFLYSGLKERQDLLLGLLLMIGFCFAVRVLFLDFSFFSQREELLYLANSPLVLMAGLYFAFVALQKLFMKLLVQEIIYSGVLLSMAVVCFAAMYVDFQRASFIALGISCIFLVGLFVYQRPLKAILPIIAIAIIVIIFHSFIFDVVEKVALKTAQVGFNMRSQELQAVWDHISNDSISLIFGMGWGSSFSSPAVGDLNVAYTHSLLSYMLLKTGLAGLGLTCLYLFFIFEKLARLVFSKAVSANALVWPFLIPIFFYASYKSLDYGLILTLILVITTALNSKKQSPLSHNE